MLMPVSSIDTEQEHPWVTRNGTDPLLAKSENVAVIIEPPTDEEVNAAITGNMGHLVTVVGARHPFAASRPQDRCTCYVPTN